jgi:hypothetical protein
MCSEVEAGNFVALVYSALLNVGKSALKMTENLWKNSLTVAKDIRIICVNVIVIAVTFSEEENGGITVVPPLVHCTRTSKACWCREPCSLNRLCPHFSITHAVGNRNDTPYAMLGHFRQLELPASSSIRFNSFRLYVQQSP